VGALYQRLGDERRERQLNHWSMSRDSGSSP
jgi:hypothetical protein